MKIDPKYKNILVDELCEFTRIPSISDTRGGNEGPLQNVVADRMRTLGARVRTFEADDVPAFYTHPLCSCPDRQYKGRPTVLGEVGPENVPALLVIAHSDTVPVLKPEEWTVEPFGGLIRDGKVFGLGVTDDKWGTAGLLSILRVLNDSGKPLRKRVILASSVDEESGIGNGMLLLTLAGVKAECGLYLDGTQLKLYIGNLGGSFFFLKPKQPIPPADFERHHKILQTACDKFNPSRSQAFDQPFFRDNLRRNQSVIPYIWKDEKGPYFNLAFYTVPGDDQDRICRQLEAMAAEALKSELSKYVTCFHSPWFEPAVISPETPIVRHMAESSRQVMGREPVIATNVKIDAFVLTNHAGIPTMSFGPSSQTAGRGAFHQPDEYLKIDEFWDAFQIACGAVCRWVED